MKKTKEIDVWVSVTEFKHYEAEDCTFVLEHEKKPNVEYHKAKFIIEIPEKKVEITESQLDKEVAKLRMGVNDARVVRYYIAQLKKQLFAE